MDSKQIQDFINQTMKIVSGVEKQVEELKKTRSKEEVEQVEKMIKDANLQEVLREINQQSSRLNDLKNKM